MTDGEGQMTKDGFQGVPGKPILKKTALWMVLLMVLAGLTQLGYFLSILAREDTPSRADAVVVFMGAPGRLKTGYELVNQGAARRIVLSPSNKNAWRRWDKKFQLRPGVRHLDEPYARTTLQNAFYASRMIRSLGLKTVILVTSDYHMPRSLALMKLFLAGDGVKLHTRKVSARDAGNMRLNHRWLMTRLVYNEMIECWGSLMEYGAYLASGKMAGERGLDGPLISFLRRALLVEARAGW